MGRKFKRTTKQYLMVAFISIVIVGVATLLAYFTTTEKVRNIYETKLTSLNSEFAENTRNVYVATEGILVGSIITEDNTEYKNVFASQPQEIYIDASDIGKTALVDIMKGTQILDSNVTDANVSSDLRETSYDVVSISGNVTSNDTVDIRVLFPNGENYIVLSKKQLINKESDSSQCYFWLSEEEILLMSSAIVDTYLYTGTQIYTTKYFEPNIQEASIVNYTPSLATIALIESDPNIVKKASEYLSRIVRKEFENRLSKSFDLKAAETELNIGNNLIEEQSAASSKTETDEYFYIDEGAQSREEDIKYGE